MKKVQIKKPDFRGFFHRMKNLKIEDLKAYWIARRERRARILEERRSGDVQVSLFDSAVLTPEQRPVPPEVPQGYMVAGCTYSDRLKDQPAPRLGQAWRISHLMIEEK